jgi:hypothetical protein
LRDSVSLLGSDHGCTGLGNIFGEYPPTLSDALDYITKNKIRMVVMLDIQGVNIAQAALNVVTSKSDDAGRPFLNSVVFKMPASLFPNGYTDIVSTFGVNALNINFIPVINTADVAPVTTTITDTEDGGFDLSDVGANGMGGEQGILNWITNVESSHGIGFLKIPAVEINIKEPGGILTGTVLPNAGSNQATGLPMTLGTFNPVGEYYPNGPTAEPQFFRSSNGSCCDYLEQYLYNNPNGTGPINPSQPVDHTDQRRNLSFQLSGTNNFRYLITDDPATAASMLVQQNKRNICYLQPSSSQTPNCSNGGVQFSSSVGQPNAPGLIDPLVTESTETNASRIYSAPLVWFYSALDIPAQGSGKVFENDRKQGTRVRRFQCGICSSTARIENRTSPNSSPNCAAQGLQILLCAPLYSIENTCAPAFMNRLLTEGLKMPVGEKNQICTHVKRVEFCSRSETNDEPN